MEKKLFVAESMMEYQQSARQSLYIWIFLVMTLTFDWKIVVGGALLGIVVLEMMDTKKRGDLLKESEVLMLPDPNGTFVGPKPKSP